MCLSDAIHDHSPMAAPYLNKMDKGYFFAYLSYNLKMILTCLLCKEPFLSTRYVGIRPIFMDFIMSKGVPIKIGSSVKVVYPAVCSNCGGKEIKVRV